MQSADDEEFKEKVLEEDFKKAAESMRKIKKEEIEKKSKNKPFLKLGIYLTVISLICLLVINYQVPWIYVKHDNNAEFFYYKNSEIATSSNNTNFTTFFQSEKSDDYLGISSFDLKSTPITQSYLLYAIIALGIAFTIFNLIIRKKEFSMVNFRIIHSIIALSATSLCIYFIYITVKFLAPNILLYYNQNLIVKNVQNLGMIYIAPIILILLISITLKICFTVLKINFRDFEKIADKTKTKKSFSSFRYGV